MCFQCLLSREDSLSMDGTVGGQRSGHHPVGSVGMLPSSLVSVEIDSMTLSVLPWSLCGFAHNFPKVS